MALTNQDNKFESTFCSEASFSVKVCWLSNHSVEEIPMIVKETGLVLGVDEQETFPIYHYKN